MELISISNFIRLFIVSSMFYQIIDYTQNYFSYKTVVKSELKQFKAKEIPSFTICRENHDWEYSSKKIVKDKDGYKFYYSSNYLNNNENLQFEILIYFISNHSAVTPFRDNEEHSITILTLL
jgi:hypothetical protein